MNIIQHNSPNYYPNRSGYKPLAICNHITAGQLSGTISWFNNKSSEVSSHFVIGRDGSIHQCVPLEHGAWTQGITKEAIAYATTPLIKQMGVNPNFYFVGIEHEGYDGNGVDGSLTEEQFLSSCLVHKYIQDYVQKKWGNKIELTPYNVVGHYQIDPRRKPNCPGKNFSWSRMYAELAIANNMSMDEYEERIDYLRNPASQRATAFAFAQRVQDLGAKLTDKRWGAEARRKLLKLTPIMEELNYSYYEGDTITAEGIVRRIIDIYKHSSDQRFEGEAFRKLMLGAKCAKEQGIL